MVTKGWGRRERVPIRPFVLGWDGPRGLGFSCDREKCDGARWLSSWDCCQRLSGGGDILLRCHSQAHDDYGEFGTDHVKVGSQPSAHSTKCSKASLPSGGRSEPQHPTNRSMSGCPNCVWVEYSEVLLQHYQDGHKLALAALERHVVDKNIKAFLRMEILLRTRQRA
ncbi:oxidoreductase-like domain-containing protein 1 [Lemur catta]|uniref:oxidoreductase-like domain-containing protein 1 n=1 Tax=Lemur catta TaxID=9447 RepID=UPI001E26E88A|nr:oxidoreductase-like domain-containing protein 1 [Lemur catta]